MEVLTVDTEYEMFLLHQKVCDQGEQIGQKHTQGESPQR